jgi:hypothetical protein
MGGLYIYSLFTYFSSSLVEGVYIQQGRKRTPEHHPRGKGGGGRLIVIETIGNAFVVHAVEAVGATHGILAVIYLFLVEEAYTQQGRAHIRRPHPDWAVRPALMSRAAHAVESKAVVRTAVRIEVAVSPRPCLLSAAASHPDSA